MNGNITKKSIMLFLIITLTISAMIEIIIINTKSMDATEILMWTPALGAFITKKIYYKNKKYVLGFKKCKWKYIWMGILFPIVYLGIPYIIFWIVYPNTLQFQMTPEFILFLVLGIPISLTTALGEEIGWRGFMVPKMFKAWGLNKMLIISSLIWGIWHLPIILAGLYLPGTPIIFKVPMFLVNIGSVSVIIAILTLRSKSVWPAALLHAAHNAYDQLMFGHYTVSDIKMYYVSETGILTSVLTVGIAVYMYLSYVKSFKNKEYI
ncbi:CPBP family intramembrane glutamic endopeptidase [Anaerosacchariphilus polymeriproducens]|uniref:CPBP family intramembrane metalloprotease n=1 Tax=Anaerosacchariphilus polymeriproducens TaxID=1812858 RepID=A0A371B012_9FIRM|nr:CPBP family intramembrane glutamic endopeptidase [Anaerosacchariphilus polymeriproducens]RDU25208.1 CPBP family intramembrane metalloprotease [Anaerosacchariphilus polymeriproducens]